jgi:3-hydroxyisobutyrate dehydrogenase
MTQLSKKFLRDQQVYCLQQSGKTIINMSNGCLETSRYLNTICNQHHVHFIDAPVSGSKPAQDGTLVILVGASTEDFE